MESFFSTGQIMWHVSDVNAAMASNFVCGTFKRDTRRQRSLIVSMDQASRKMLNGRFTSNLHNLISSKKGFNVVLTWIHFLPFPKRNWVWTIWRSRDDSLQISSRLIAVSGFTRYQFKQTFCFSAQKLFCPVVHNKKLLWEKKCAITCTEDGGKSEENQYLIKPIIRISWRRGHKQKACSDVVITIPINYSRLVLI